MSQFIETVITSTNSIVDPRNGAGFTLLRTRAVYARLSAGLHTSEREGKLRNSLAHSALRGSIREFLNAYGMVWVAKEDSDFYLLMDKELDVPKLWILVDTGPLSIEYKLCGDPELTKEIHHKLEEKFPRDGVVVSTAFMSERGLSLQSHHLVDKENERPRQSFFPFLKCDLHEYYRNYMAARESVLVLFGDPGTGKSTFLRGLILEAKKTAMVAYDRDVIQTPALIRRFYDSSAWILAMEDVDAYIGERTEGNHLMQTYLNNTEGIVLRQNKKIVFSTNLKSIDKIDAALLRAGRNYDILEFKHLTVEEAHAVQEDMKLPRIDLSSKAKWALAEILNPLDDKRQNLSRFRQGIGFGQGK